MLVAAAFADSEKKTLQEALRPAVLEDFSTFKTRPPVEIVNTQFSRHQDVYYCSAEYFRCEKCEEKST